MTRNFPVFILLSTVAAIVGCNSDSEYISTTSSSAVVTSFSLAEDDSVLENLDSIYFSIDLVNALIYNADSLPYGTKTDKLVANIGIEQCSAAELYVSRANQSDTVINYLTNSTDSIDFSNGPVTLHLTSYDGVTTRDYSISVNVHQIEPDSLYWSSLDRKSLPTSFGVPARQKTVELGTSVYCLTGVDDKYCLAVSSDLDSWQWQIEELTPGFTPDIDSFNATSEALYILDDQGRLYSSSDGLTWSDCGVVWSHIYGGYGSTLLGVETDNGTYYHASYPSTGSSAAVEEDCPVSGTSQLITFENDWDIAPQAVMLGGRLSNGSLTSSAWGFDGTTWAKLSGNSFDAREKMTLFAYFTYKTDTDNWSVTKYTTLIALGGMTATPEVQNEVYISLDQGIHWKLADDLLQLPDYIPAMADAQAIVFSTTMKSVSTLSASWESFAPKSLPRWWSVKQAAASTKATAPITEWECPYIYLFGGTNSQGALYDTVWRGVISRLSFKPLQ